jgi:hypothetical protein
MEVRNERTPVDQRHIKRTVGQSGQLRSRSLRLQGDGRVRELSKHLRQCRRQNVLSCGEVVADVQRSRPPGRRLARGVGGLVHPLDDGARLDLERPPRRGQPDLV